MKHYLLLTLLTFGAKLGLSQWTDMSTPAIYHLYSVEAVTNDIIYAGGYGGSLVRTTDAGDSWQSVPIGTSDWVKAIHFFNPSEGWVATTSGSSNLAQLLKTTNGGDTWTIMHDTEEYSTMYWPSATIGYIGTASGKVLKTTDGGDNWLPTSLTTGSNIYEMQFLDDQTGFVFGLDYYLRKTTDGGITWDSIYQPDVQHIFFLDENIGYCIDGSGRVGKTTDGGQSYDFWQSPFNGYKLQDVHFTNEFTGYVVGGVDCSNGTCTTKPAILTTNDGGVTWNNDLNHPFVGQERGFYEIDVTPNGTPFIAGSDAFVLKNEAIASITDLSSSSAPLIFPNPNTGKFTIETSMNTEKVQVFSTSGVLVYEITSDFNSTTTIELENVQNGMYFVHSHHKNGTTHTEKFIVKK